MSTLLERLSCAAVLAFFVFHGTGISQVEYGIAGKYPYDNGLKNDPSVVFSENFEEGSIDQMLVNWPSFKGKATMSLSPDKPVYSSGNLSLYVSGGWMDMYRQLLPGYDTLYVRYYSKLDPSCTVVHHWPWMGGHNPPTFGPDPRAGVPPSIVGNVCYNDNTGEQRTDLTNCGPSPWYVTGNTINRFSTGVEPASFARWDFYSYWPTMPQSNDGKYWGVGFGNGLTVPVNKGQWICIEFMVKLNNPASSKNGEQAFWINGEKKLHLGPGFPMGRYYNGFWYNNDCRSACVPFEGIQWRTTMDLKINYFWLEHFVDTDLGCEGWFDDLVISKKYIGPQVNKVTGIAPTTSGANQEPGIFRSQVTKTGTVRFNLPLLQAGNYTFRVLDLAGRELFLHHGTASDKGQCELVWQGDKNITAGIYCAQLTQGGATRFWRFSSVP